MINRNQTICAISTGSLESAIAVIRLTGEDAIDIVKNVFSPRNKKRFSNPEAFRLYFGNIMDVETVIDEVLVSVFLSPNSYTGENMIEISCHGSIFIQQSILELLQKNGAVMASPGEFTMRAYQNGKLDLSQAEAVADLISSKSKLAHQVAMNQMRGGVSNQLKVLRQELLQFISLLELELDFGEEDVEFVNRADLEQLIENINTILNRLIESFEKGNAIKNGVPVAIIGEPNVGKSTLLNAILSEEKAIVSNIPGTTRDVVEDIFNINGVDYRFFDTAGLRETEDLIENMGIERTHKKIDEAQIILALFNADDSIFKIDNGVQKLLDKYLDDNKHIILVLNKSDLDSIKTDYQNDKLSDIVKISAKNNENIDVLLDAIMGVCNLNDIGSEEVIISNVRHLEAFVSAQSAINRALEGLQNGISSDFLAMDIREAIFYLAGITKNEITTDEVLGNIFSQFCIGK